MKKFTYLLMVVSLWLPSWVQSGVLTEIIQKTLETHPDVLMTQDNYRAAEQAQRRAQAGYLPTLDLIGGYGRENSDNATTRNRYPEGDVTLTRQEIGLTLSQMLFDGFQVKYEVRRQGARVDSAAYQIQDTRENVVLATVEAYLEILRHQELIELAKNNVVVHQKTLAQIHELVTGGAGRQADIQQSMGRLALAKSTLVNTEGLGRNAQINYQHVTGEVPPVELPQPQTEKQQVTAVLPETLETALNVALESHPALKATQADLRVAQAEHRQTDAAFMPHFSLDLSASDNNNLDGIEGDNDDLSAMLRMRYNLYRGGADKARRQETAERISAAREMVRRTQRTVEKQVNLAWNSLLTVRSRLDHLEKHAQSMREVLQSYKEQHKLGQRSLLDVLDSENELFSARSSVVTGQYTRMLGEFRLLASMGLLLKTLEIQTPTAVN
jgi:adhesin transport system outer membrane protein